MIIEVRNREIIEQNRYYWSATLIKYFNGDDSPIFDNP